MDKRVVRHACSRELVCADTSAPEGGLGGDEGDEEDLELQLALTLSASEAEGAPTLPPGLGRSAAPPGLGAPQGLASSAALPPGLPPGLGQ